MIQDICGCFGCDCLQIGCDFGNLCVIDVLLQNFGGNSSVIQVKMAVIVDLKMHESVDIGLDMFFGTVFH